MIIEGGTYEVLDCTIVTVHDTAKVVIKGGHFSINENCSWGSTYLINKKDGSATTVSISGGTFIDFDPSHSNSENPEENFVVAGYKVENNDGVYTVVSAINYTEIKDLLDNNSDKLGITITTTPSSKYFLVKGTFVEYQSTKNGTDTAKQYGNIFIQDENGNKILIYGIYTIDGKRFDSTGIEGLTDMAVGDEIVVYGPAQTYNNTPQLANTLLAVWKDTRYVSGDALLETVAPAEMATTDIKLDSRATWTSNNAAIAISGTTGTVTRGAEDISVTLTATLVDPFTGEEMTRDFTVVVKAAIAGEQTVTMKYTGSTTGNMADGNNATAVGLSADIFTITSDKNTGSNHVGLNKDGTMRLYGNKNTVGEGVIMTIKVAEGYQINSITINFGTTVANYTINGGDTLSPTSGGATTHVINGDTVVIKNVHQTNVQLWITSIVISYQPIAA